MKDYANRDWLLGFKEPKENKAIRTLIILTLATIALMMLPFMAVTTYLDYYPPVAEDMMLSPDMTSFIESGKAPMVIKEEDVQ